MNYSELQNQFRIAFEAIHNIETQLFSLQGEEVAKQNAAKAIEISKRHNLIRKALRDVVKANALLGNANYTHFLAENSECRQALEKSNPPHFMGEPI